MEECECETFLFWPEPTMLADTRPPLLEWSNADRRADEAAELERAVALLSFDRNHPISIPTPATRNVS